eukprot:11213854-Lingulodinium_polyedra.AAC.1
MRLRSPSAERELCMPWVKHDRCVAPVVLIRAHHGQGNEQLFQRVPLTSVAPRSYSTLCSVCSMPPSFPSLRVYFASD